MPNGCVCARRHPHLANRMRGAAPKTLQFIAYRVLAHVFVSHCPVQAETKCSGKNGGGCCFALTASTQYFRTVCEVCFFLRNARTVAGVVLCGQHRQHFRIVCEVCFVRNAIDIFGHACFVTLPLACTSTALMFLRVLMREQGFDVVLTCFWRAGSLFFQGRSKVGGVDDVFLICFHVFFEARAQL